MEISVAWLPVAGDLHLQPRDFRYMCGKWFAGLILFSLTVNMHFVCVHHYQFIKWVGFFRSLLESVYHSLILDSLWFAKCNGKTKMSFPSLSGFSTFIRLLVFQSTHLTQFVHWQPFHFKQSDKSIFLSQISFSSLTFCWMEWNEFLT